MLLVTVVDQRSAAATTVTLSAGDRRHRIERADLRLRWSCSPVAVVECPAVSRPDRAADRAHHVMRVAAEAGNLGPKPRVALLPVATMRDHRAADHEAENEPGTTAANCDRPRTIARRSNIGSPAILW